MKNLRTIFRALILFVGFSFLFGQLFVGNFDIPATMTGIFGLAFAVVAGENNYESGKNRATIITVGSVCFIGVMFDVLSYYMSNPSPGNYYAWFLIGPYIIAVFFLMQQFGVKCNTRKEGDVET
jgi:hypothetical protein